MRDCLKLLEKLTAKATEQFFIKKNNIFLFFWKLQNTSLTMKMHSMSTVSDFIWPSPPYVGVIDLYFPNFLYFSAYFPNFIEISSQIWRKG